MGILAENGGQEEKSTPRPWHTAKNDSTVIIGADQARVALFDFAIGMSREEMKANALIAVTAVNERDQLLSSLAEKEGRIKDLEIALAWALKPELAHTMHELDCEWQFSPRNDVCNCYLGKARALADGSISASQGGLSR